MLSVPKGKYAEAGALYEKSHAIRKKTFGGDHPDVAASLSNWAWVLQQQASMSNKQVLKRASTDPYLIDVADLHGF